MFNHSDFTINNGKLVVKEDKYELSRIRSVEVKQSTLSSHLLKALVLSLLASCILWLFDPKDLSISFDLNLGAIVLFVTFPIVFVFSYLRSRYQLKIEFEHTDEVGLQWVSVANGRSTDELQVFLKIKERLTQVIV